MQRVQGLDLLRGLAVALVMLRHVAPQPFQGAGVVGVVMFFALSGYLITGVICAELAATGRLDLGRFYLRRAIRLVPALLLMMAVFVLVTLTLDPLDDRADLVRTVMVALTYTADLPFHHGSDATYHLWTLAVEEQFYLVWPTVLLLAWGAARLRAALLASAAVCLAATIGTLLWLAPHFDLAYTLPTVWAGCFVIGAAARVLADRRRTLGAGRPRILVPVALGALLVLSVVPLRGHAWTYLLGGPAIATATAVLMLAWRDWYEVRPRLLRVVVALGTVSYGAYLWNYPLSRWLPPEAGVLAVALTIVAAALSWRFVEHPVLRRWGRRTRVPVVALGRP